VVPGVTATVSAAVAGRPPEDAVASLDDAAPAPPTAPVATNCRDVTPVGTVKDCSPPVYANVIVVTAPAAAVETSLDAPDANATSNAPANVAPNVMRILLCGHLRNLGIAVGRFLTFGGLAHE
jgi:hypothetical protein